MEPENRSTAVRRRLSQIAGLLQEKRFETMPGKGKILHRAR